MDAAKLANDIKSRFQVALAVFKVIVTEKGLPLQPVSGWLEAVGRKETTDRDKARTVNSFQD